MYILGISCFYHDSAACLVRDGTILAAAQEERFTRIKHDQEFPSNAVAYCLREAGISIDEVEYVAFYDKPLLKFERILETYFAFAPRGFIQFLKAIPTWIKQKLWIRELIEENLGYAGPILFPEHHHSHAASAFYPSPFERAAVLTMDGVGEWATTSFGVGDGNDLTIRADIRFPHSLGLLYSALTYYLGFKVNSGEYKVMGLAPYGEPRFAERIKRELIDIKDDGSFHLNMAYFNYCVGLTMTNRKFEQLFGERRREPEGELTQFHMDVAASLQQVTEEAIFAIARHVRKETGERYLCLAGGVALNSVANGKLERAKIFDAIWIQPAAGDAGGALGAALAAYHGYAKGKRHVSKEGRDAQSGSLLGPAFTNEEIEAFLTGSSIPSERLADPAQKAAELINGGSVVGWFQGRMEFGPRALGARSILGDARSPETQKTMNLKIKFREGFRPFAPSVLAEKSGEYFEMEGESPYMLLVAPVRDEHRRTLTEEDAAKEGLAKLDVVRSSIPAVTHVDYSARVQTVDRDVHPGYHALLRAMDEQYGCPVIVNTSFNVRGEPIVHSPEDAYRCFMRTNMDYLILGDFLLEKTRQPAWSEEGDWKEEFELD